MFSTVSNLANGDLECLEKKMETNGDYLLHAALNSVEKCSRIILFLW